MKKKSERELKDDLSRMTFPTSHQVFLDNIWAELSNIRSRVMQRIIDEPTTLNQEELTAYIDLVIELETLLFTDNQL